MRGYSLKAINIFFAIFIWISFLRFIQKLLSSHNENKFMLFLKKLLFYVREFVKHETTFLHEFLESISFC